MRNRSTMTQGPMALNILLYTIPIVLTSWLQLLFNAADLVVVGRFCGSLSVAAVGSTSAITNLIINLFIGLSVGAGVCTAHAIGSREDDRLHRIIHTAIPTAILAGVFLTVFGVCFAGKLLQMMGTPETVLPLAAVYMRLYFMGMTFNMVYNFAASILRAAGDTKSPLIILAVAGFINVVLNIILVTRFNMNVAGVALATAVSQAFSAVYSCVALMRRTDGCRLELKKMHIYGPQLKKMIRIGLPAGIQSSMFSLSNTVIQSSVNSFGDVVVSGCAAVGNVESFCYVTVNAFHQAAVNYVGQNLGAGKMDRVKRSLLLCLAYVTGAGLLTGLSANLFGRQILSLYLPDSEAAIAVGLHRITYTCTLYFIYGLMDTITGALRGMGESLVTMIISILGICGLRIVWVYTIFRIPAYHTLESLYLSWPISWIVTLIFQLAAFLILYRKYANALRGEKIYGRVERYLR